VRYLVLLGLLAGSALAAPAPLYDMAKLQMSWGGMWSSQLSGERRVGDGQSARLSLGDCEKS